MNLKFKWQGWSNISGPPINNPGHFLTYPASHVSQTGPQYPCGRELSRQKSAYPGYPGIPIYCTPEWFRDSESMMHMIRADSIIVHIKRNTTTLRLRNFLGPGHF
jgi:hypothetical protein